MIASSPLLDETLAEVDKLQQSHVAEYRLVVQKLFRGEKVAPARVASVLADAGKTSDDLRRDIAKREHRQRLREAMNREADHAQRQQELEAELAKANAALEEAVQAHQAATAPLQYALSQARDGIRAAFVAKLDLQHGCDNPLLLQRQQEIHHEANRIDEERKAARDRVERLQATLGEVVDNIATGDSSEAEKKRAEQKLAEAKTALAEIDQRRADLVAAGEALVQAMIDD